MPKGGRSIHFTRGTNLVRKSANGDGIMEELKLLFLAVLVGMAVGAVLLLFVHLTT